MAKTKHKPWWKGRLIDRAKVKKMLEDTMVDAATHDYDEAVGKMLNDLEVHMGNKLMEHVEGVLLDIKRDINKALETVRDFAKPLAQEALRRRLAREEEDAGGEDTGEEEGGEEE